MMEELISFDTAKLAKEKGFDWPVKQAWANFAQLDKKSNWSAISVDHYIQSDSRRIPAPTQSLLQKWLRDKCRLDINVYNEFDHVYSEDYTYELHQHFGVNDEEERDNEYKTYEEALEAALIKALELL